MSCSVWVRRRDRKAFPGVGPRHARHAPNSPPQEARLRKIINFRGALKDSLVPPGRGSLVHGGRVSGLGEPLGDDDGSGLSPPLPVLCSPRLSGRRACCTHGASNPCRSGSEHSVFLYRWRTAVHRSSWHHSSDDHCSWSARVYWLRQWLGRLRSFDNGHDFGDWR